MKIAALRTRSLRVPLSRPYAIAGHSWDHVELAACEVEDEAGNVGFGQASPAEEVSGEAFGACAAQLSSERLAMLIGHEAGEIEARIEQTREVLRGPAARAALDMALFDLRAKSAGRPLVDQLGRVPESLATSITIGLKSLEETLEEAREYLGRCFRVLKVKIGVDVDADLERLQRLRENHGAKIVLRADANQGYDLKALQRFLAQSAGLDLEMLEQPMQPALDDELRALSQAQRRSLACDESVHDARDLERMIAAGPMYGIVNVKLMKCGGIAEALRMAQIAERAGLSLMWGCMDESVLGIAAALHAAYACPATRYLDLDGSLDLAEDPFIGGFLLDGDRMQTLKRPGLGVRLP